MNWVSTDQAMPDSDVICIIALADRDVVIAKIDVAGGDWLYTNGDRVTDIVTHWMPWPIAPEIA